MVTLFSPDGAYGGPTRVAVNQARELTVRGHEVTLVGAARGFSTAPQVFDGVPVRTFPARRAIPMTGFAGLWSPGLLRDVIPSLPGYDAVHVHLARDLVTLPVAVLALIRGVPLVLQCHGMVDLTTNPLAVPLDAAGTRRVLRGASRVLALTPREEQDIRDVARGDVALTRLVNGVPTAVAPTPPSTYAPEVLYLARLHKRKRPVHFVEAAAALAREFPEVRFTLVGPDEGEAEGVRERIAASGSERVTLEDAIPPEDTLARMSSAAFYVLPSVDEPFPMSVLEAMSLGLPVVITTSCGLATAVEESGAGIVVDDSTGALTQGIRTLLEDAELRRSMGARARDLVEREFSMHAVAQQLEQIYESSRRRPRSVSPEA